MNDPYRIVVVTGLSGAGMSSSLKVLEDLGYEVLDNFPLALTGPLLDDSESNGRAIAIGIDTRTRGFDTAAVIDMVRRRGARLLFVTCDDTVLQKRFTETRRRHPLARDRPVSDGIKKEQAALYALREYADPVIDTSALSVHDLRRVIEGHFALERTGRISVSVVSFGFRHGLPREADIVMDVRFLRNPHWDPVLRPLTGMDGAVQDYISADDGFAPFIQRFQELTGLLLPRYVQEGKSYLTIAVGCTGGRHRSVYVAERMAEWLRGQDMDAYVQHRDVER